MRRSRMPQQPESASPSLTVSPAPAPGPMPLFTPTREQGEPSAERPQSQHAPQRIPRWLERSEMFLRVLLQMYIGLFVCYAPWWRMFWDRNPLFLQFPTLATFACNGAVRGVVSGLGLLNLWIAFSVVLKRRDQ